jgi:hypothetical protein
MAWCSCIIVLCACINVLCGCTIHQPAERCASCRIVDRAHPRLPRLHRGTRREFVLVPGVLGYGWEWDGAVAALERAPATDFFVFWWEPWASLKRSSEELRAVLQAAVLQPGIDELVVVAHSAGGMVAAYAVSSLAVPPGRSVKVVTIGTPFAGMMGPPFSLDDPVRSPAMIAMMGTFLHYPDLPSRVEFIEYVTSWPSDPVMQSRYGHEVAPPSVGPRGARRIPVDPKLDHNKTVALVVEQLLRAGPDVVRR